MLMEDFCSNLGIKKALSKQINIRSKQMCFSIFIQPLNTKTLRTYYQTTFMFQILYPRKSFEMENRTLKLRYDKIYDKKENLQLMILCFTERFWNNPIKVRFF